MPEKWQGSGCDLQEKSAQADAHGAGDVQHVAVAGHAAGLAGNVSQRVGGHMAVDHGDGHAVVLVRHETGSVGAELGGQHAVIGAGAAAALHVPGTQMRVSAPVISSICFAMRAVAVV